MNVPGVLPENAAEWIHAPQEISQPAEVLVAPVEASRIVPPPEYLLIVGWCQGCGFQYEFGGFLHVLCTRDSHGCCHFGDRLLSVA